MPSMAYASISNNPEGICILCNAGADPQAENQINIPMLDVCSGYGSLAALEALLAHALPGTLNFSQALWSSMWCSRGGTAEMVERLVGLRADVNHQRKIRTGSALDIFQVAKAKSRQHQSDEATTLAAARIFYFLPSDAACISRMSCCCSSSLLSTFVLSTAMKYMGTRGPFQGSLVPHSRHDAADGSCNNSSVRRCRCPHRMWCKTGLEKLPRSSSCFVVLYVA